MCIVYGKKSWSLWVEQRYCKVVCVLFFTVIKFTNIAFLEDAPCFYAFMLIYALFLQLRITWLTFSLYWNLTCLSKHHLDATSSLKSHLITHMSVLTISSKFLLLFVYTSFQACKTVSLIFEFLIEALFLPQNCKLLRGRKADLFILWLLPRNHVLEWFPVILLSGWKPYTQSSVLLWFSEDKHLSGPL